MSISILRTMAAGLVLLFSLAVQAQDKLYIKGKTTDKYVVYKTNGKESLQSISNAFGLSVQKISAYNKININAGKSFGKGTEIKIPITQNNLLQHPAENAEPVLHVIGKGENLFRVSQAYHKVPLASLRSWNHLKKDAVTPGQEIIVGYMVNAKQATTVAEKKAETKKEDAAATAAQDKAMREKDLNASGGALYTQLPPPADKVNTEKTDPLPTPVRNDVVVNEPVVITSPATSTARPAEKKASVDANSTYVPKEGDEGYFALDYSDHPKEQSQQFRSGDAAIFKTISGWTDRKFYVLMNDVAPKTIVRITGPSNKSICAMVLGPLQETKGGNGLLLRVSNSGATALGLNADKFTVTVTYFE